jgi:16S rRNA (cytidine1402-2'-O)-methyltransferase
MIRSIVLVGFLPRHGPSRKERLMMASANEARTQIFYVLPHKFSQFLKEFSSLFGMSRYIWHILIV